jgi:predicted kinase
MDKIICILVGIPCSGKSSWVKDNTEACDDGSHLVISRDDIRDKAFPKPYKITNSNEAEVSRLFNHILQSALTDDTTEVIYLDNTHCKEKYLQAYLQDDFIRGHANRIIIKFFDCPWWLAQVRNIGRWAYTGKWIPIDVITNMYKNYNKIKKHKYATYLLY